MIDWALDWDPASIAVAVLVAAVTLVAAWVGSAALNDQRKRFALLAVRALAVLTVVAALMQPVWVTLEPYSGGRAVAVMLDQSTSMARGSDGTRFDRAKRAIGSLRKH